MSRQRAPATMSQLTGAWVASRRGQIHVYRLHWSISPGTLRKYFGKFGQVDSIHIPYDLDSGLSKGFGFVRMADNDVVPEILEQKHHVLGDFNIMVTSTLNWRKSMSIIRDSTQEGSANTSRGKTVNSHSNPTPDSRSHDPTDEWESSDSNSQLSSSVDPPPSSSVETTPTDTGVPLESDGYTTDMNSSSVDPPSVVDTPTLSQTSSV